MRLITILRAPVSVDIMTIQYRSRIVTKELIWTGNLNQIYITNLKQSTYLAACENMCGRVGGKVTNAVLNIFCISNFSEFLSHLTECFQTSVNTE